jgi:hypothetical protein
MDTFFDNYSDRLGDCRKISAVLVMLCGLPMSEAQSDEWPRLPETNGTVELPAQSWDAQPGPRTIRVLIHYPGGTLKRVTDRTGIMLSLHNWGGVDCVGTADPQALAERLNVVAVCVNYLQSGPDSVSPGGAPYDFGYLQALDALRALWFVYSSLQEQERPFDQSRIFATGGSGGGNVTLMANKLAPRTFSCIVDMCGMPRLTDDPAHGAREAAEKVNAPGARPPWLNDLSATARPRASIPAQRGMSPLSGVD